MKKIFQSFKLRLFFVIFVIGSAIAVFLGNIITKAYTAKAIEVSSIKIADELKGLADDIDNYALTAGNDIARGVMQNDIKARLYQLSKVYDGRLMVINQDLKIIYDSYDASVGKFITSKQIIECIRPEFLNGNDRADLGNVISDKIITNIDNENGYIEFAVPIINYAKNDVKEADGVIFASYRLEGINTISRFLTKRSFNFELISILVLSIVAFIVSSIISAPFSRITSKIREFTDFDETGKIEESAYIETSEIADAFNGLQDRLKILDESRQEFVSNVSHELKTPITSIKVLADSINSEENVPNELYKEFMQDIVNEIDRENSIITDLLSLVKLDKGEAALNIDLVNVDEMLDLIIRRLDPIAATHGVDIDLECLKAVDAEIDEVKMTLALTNLIENGIKYNRSSGWVKVTLDADNQFFTVTIKDSGIGIAKEELDHIFERFYRVDKSHSREIGGTGLGLAIARKTILLHRGFIKVDSVVSEGTTFTVRLPIYYAGA